MNAATKPMPRLRRGDRLVVATHNAGKLDEIARLLAPHGIAVDGSAALGLAEPEETGDSFAANARLKAVAAARASRRPALADDSGLAVAALGGAPGIYSARWAGPDKDFPMAMRRVNDELGGRGPGTDRSATFVAVIAFATPEGDCALFEGRVDGEVTWPPRGSGGHGYDPIFVPQGETRTFAELAPARKNALSHRGRALAKFIAACVA